MSEEQNGQDTADELEEVEFLAVVLTAGPELPSAQEVVDYVKREFPKAPDLLLGEAGETSSDELQLLTQNRLVTVRRGEGRLSEDDIEFCTSRAWWWPEAAAETAGHTEHLVVSLRTLNGTPVEDSLMLTFVAAAVGALTKSVAILWTQGDRLSSPDEFLELTRSYQAEDAVVPLPLWVEVQVGEDEKGDMSALYTTGMEALGFHEVEVWGSTLEPVELVERTWPLLYCIVDTDLVFEDGGCFENVDGSLIPVHYAPSVLDEEREVLVVEFP